jgi:hypothetical protein
MGTDTKDKGAYENLTRIPTLDEESPISDSQHQLPLHDTPSPPLRMHTSTLTVGLRGRTLGLFTARNPLRRAMNRVLRFSYVLMCLLSNIFHLPLAICRSFSLATTNTHSWTEPIILTLIVLNVGVLTAQAWEPLFEPRLDRGYFVRWEDTALFVLFIIFTYVYSINLW